MLYCKLTNGKLLGADADGARLTQTLTSGVPEQQNIKDGRNQFETRQMHMQMYDMFTVR